MLLAGARQLQASLREQAGVDYAIVAGLGAPLDQTRIILSLAPGSATHEQGYSLTITPDRVDVVAVRPEGIFYGVQTLRQLLADKGAQLTCLHCNDWPDFSNRGVMLDVSRDRVPTQATLFNLIDLLASWKVNQIQFYTEHTFAYRRHPAVWTGASPLTGEDILALDAYCQERFIELVPNQNTFGHMSRWLALPQYRSLAECPDGSDTLWGRMPAYGLAPTEPGSIIMVCELLDELLPHFRSRQVNVGCDETVDLGLGRSQALCAARGTERVYLDFVMQIYREVKARGHTMQFWGDILMDHPELAPELPRDAIALEWGYEAGHPFAEHGAVIAASGIPFYVCPGTSSWRSLAGRTDNALANLDNAATHGLEHGAVGYLNTDWGDEGHWQPLPVSYLGLLYGAGLGWCTEANRAIDVATALDIHAFGDGAGVMGRLAYDLGNVYKAAGPAIHNSSPLFNVLQGDPAQLRTALATGDLAFRMTATIERIYEIMAVLPTVDMRRPDGDLILDEFAWAASMLRHACHRALWIAGEGASRPNELAAEAGDLIDRYRSLWLARNRPGGLGDSVGRMVAMRSQYMV